MTWSRTRPLERARSSPGAHALVATDTGTVAAVVSGDRRPDVPEVVLVHGVTDTAATWRSVQPALASETRVHAVDLPGHGLSDLPDRPLTVAEMADAVSAYLDAADVASVVAVGNSLGGGVTLGLCARDRARVRAGVLLGSIGAPSKIPFPLTLLRRRPFAELMAWVIGAPLRRLLMRNSFGPGFRPDPDYVTAYYEAWRIAGRGPAIRELMRSLDVAEPRPWLESIEVPVHLVHGELDRLVPTRVAREIAAALPDGRLTVLDGIGHVPQLECPDRTIEVIRTALARR